MIWDVVIAGAGPAGAIAALVLARAGARVLVLERATFPRPKLCGDTVNPGAVRILRDLDVAHVLDGALPLEGMLITGAMGVSVSASYPAGVAGQSLPRTILDERLARAAAAAGATVEEGVLVRGAQREASGRVNGVAVLRNGRPHPIDARIVIAADGHHSRLARSLGLSGSARTPRRWALGGLFADVSEVGRRGEMHIRGGHYIGIAPLPDGSANVCAVTDQGKGLTQRDGLCALIDQHDALRHRFSHATPMQRPVLLGPLAVDASACGCPGLLVAGDAAGFIDPMTGDGLRFAFEGARLAAFEALRALEHGWKDAHVRLADARSRAFGVKWRFNRTLRGIVGAPAAVQVAAAVSRLVPSLVDRAVCYAGDVP